LCRLSPDFGVVRCGFPDDQPPGSNAEIAVNPLAD
jgi:hypothetical protein